MKFFNKIIVGLIVVSALNSNAQDLSMDYYSFLYNKFNINPAFCAKGDKLSAILNVRQRSGLSSNNSMLGINGLLGDNQGLGARVISDNRGAFQVLKADATYGYKVKVNDNQNVYFGLSAGLTSKSINKAKINNYDQLDLSDPALETSNLKSNSFSTGAGLIYDFKAFEFSVSAPQLLESSQKISPTTVFITNYKFELNNDISVTPELFYFNLPVVKNYGGVQVKGDYKNLVWTQLGYQTNSAFNLALGVKFNIFELGYGYMASNNLMKNLSNGTHEVLLKIGISNKSQKNVSLDNSSVDKNQNGLLGDKKTNVDLSGYTNRLNSIIDKLNELTAADANVSKADLKVQLDVLRNELKQISNSSFSSEDPETLEKKLILIEGKIQQIENSIKNK
ncbi:MAG: PorP/SprF family type IX secretion system membrane protein [Bacteroidota bacterium]